MGIETIQAKEVFHEITFDKTEKHSIFVLAVGLSTSVSTFLRFIKEIHRMKGTLHPLTK